MEDPTGACGGRWRNVARWRAHPWRASWNTPAGTQAGRRQSGRHVHHGRAGLHTRAGEGVCSAHAWCAPVERRTSSTVTRQWMYPLRWHAKERAPARQAGNHTRGGRTQTHGPNDTHGATRLTGQVWRSPDPPHLSQPIVREQVPPVGRAPRKQRSSPRTHACATRVLGVTNARNPRAARGMTLGENPTRRMYTR